MGLRHEGSAPLLPVDDEANLVCMAVKAVQHGQVAFARYTKRVRDALCHQALDQQVAADCLTIHGRIMAIFKSFPNLRQQRSTVSLWGWRAGPRAQRLAQAPASPTPAGLAI